MHARSGRSRLRDPKPPRRVSGSVVAATHTIPDARTIAKLPLHFRDSVGRGWYNITATQPGRSLIEKHSDPDEHYAWWVVPVYPSDHENRTSHAPIQHKRATMERDLQVLDMSTSVVSSDGMINVIVSGVYRDRSHATFAIVGRKYDRDPKKSIAVVVVKGDESKIESKR